jgi:hypothetical protein
MRAKEDFARPMESLIAPHFAHLNSHVKTLNPSSNSLILESGETVRYDYLVVSPGLKSSTYFSSFALKFGKLLIRCYRLRCCEGTTRGPCKPLIFQGCQYLLL